MAVPAATVAAILTVFVWHVVAGLPLLTGFPPALFAFGITWLFARWVWPFDAARRAKSHRTGRDGPRWPM